MAQGIVKWFDRKKGFGFISPDLGALDVFVHVSALNGEDALMQGDRVQFELTQLRDGRVSAFDVQMISPARDRQRNAANGT
ncbi:MAG: cold shock domain-containing protein [Pacificimonas sp.]